MKTPKAWEKKGRPGTWEAKGVDPDTGAQRSFYGRSASEASQKALQSFGILRNDSLCAYYESAYLPSVRTRSYSWKQQIAWAFDNHIAPAIGNADLATITRQEVQALMNSLNRSLAPKSVSHVYKVLSGILALAEADQAIERTPCVKIRLAAIPEPHKEKLTPSQLYQLFTSAHDTVKNFIALAGFCGLRLGEATGTPWNHIEDSWLRVQQQARQNKGEGLTISGTLKTPQSYRSIPIPAELLAELKANRKSAIYVCGNADGGALLPKSVGKELEAACRLSGVPRVSPHELRHTFCSILENEIEAPRPVVRALMGHGKGNMTDGYSKADRAQLERWMEKFWTTCKASVTYKFSVREAEL